jgi:hypothetical protein
MKETLGENKIMFTKKMFTIFVIALFSFISTTSEIKAQDSKTIKVDSTKKAVDTGVKLEPGDIVEVTNVTGQVWVSGPADGSGGVSFTGNSNIPNIPGYANSYQFSKATPHSLVAYVGNTKNHYQVRKSIFHTAPVAGNLFFAFNDNMTHYDDNKGVFDVTYKIIKKAKICSVDSGPELNFSWVNKTGAPITVSWINFKCVEEAPQTVQPNASYGGKTYIGHIFRIRDAKSKQEIGLVTVEPSSAKVDILLPTK